MADFKTPLDVRLACRENRLRDTVASRALPGYLCVNIVMLDADWARRFQDFCRANSRPCPLLGVIEPGRTDYPPLARELDIRTDLGSYDVLRDGRVVEHRSHVKDLFHQRMSTLLIGSSVSFDGLLAQKGLGASFGPRIFLTDLPCTPVGPFAGNMMVTVRSFDPAVTDKVAEYTSHFPACHGAPLARNDPRSLGIADTTVDYIGRPVDIPRGHDTLYWACGVTPSVVAQAARPPLMIAHTPGHAMITDVATESLYDRPPGP